MNNYDWKKQLLAFADKHCQHAPYHHSEVGDKTFCYWNAIWPIISDAVTARDVEWDKVIKMVLQDKAGRFWRSLVAQIKYRMGIL